jgi:hypothetical protein
MQKLKEKGHEAKWCSVDPALDAPRGRRSKARPCALKLHYSSLTSYPARSPRSKAS